MNPCVIITIPAKAEYLSVVRLTLNGIAANVGFSFEEIEDMKIAVAEACNNAVIHAYSEEQAGSVEVSFNIVEKGLDIHVKDEGISLDTAHKLEKAVSHHNKSLNEIRTSGLGLYLMKSLMDNVQVISGRGTEIILTKLHCRSKQYA